MSLHAYVLTMSNLEENEKEADKEDRIFQFKSEHGILCDQDRKAHRPFSFRDLADDSDHELSLHELLCSWEKRAREREDRVASLEFGADDALRSPSWWSFGSWRGE